MSEFDPYRPPQAPLLDPHLPAAFVGGAWSRSQLRVLGALALGYLFGLFVLLALSLWQLLHPQFAPLPLTHLLGLLLALLWGYLLLRLRALLASRFGLHDGLDWPLTLQIVLGLLAVGFAALLDEQVLNPLWLDLGSFALFVALGLSVLRFALCLQRIPQPYPALRLLAWLLLLAGIACASVVLLVPALLLGLAAGAALAWVFFTAAGELPE
ncbi:MAG: hypothetical protein NDI93_09920 [Pseudomonas sp.]|nr:hypothetical protein [Pseudomonas sp.]